MSIKSISIHPKFAAILDLVAGGLFLLVFKNVFAVWFLLSVATARMFVWLVIVRLTYYPENIKRFWHLLSLAVFHIGAISLLLFIEWNFAWWLVAAIYLVFPVISFWLLPARSQNLLSFIQKPYRRWRFWMSAFGLYGIWIGIFAAISLQIVNVNYWWFLVFGSLLTAAFSSWWWFEYGIERNEKFLWWSGAVAIFITEIAWILYLWPLGYFVSSLVLVWLWYTIWLMARFYLLPAGIHWKKQISFFAVNGFLFLVFLILIVKWK